MPVTISDEDWKNLWITLRKREQTLQDRIKELEAKLIEVSNK